MTGGKRNYGGSFSAAFTTASLSWATVIEASKPALVSGFVLYVTVGPGTLLYAVALFIVE